MDSSTTYVINTAAPAERIEKVDYISSKGERKMKLLQDKVIPPAILNSSHDLETRFK